MKSDNILFKDRKKVTGIKEKSLNLKARTKERA